MEDLHAQIGKLQAQLRQLEASSDSYEMLMEADGQRQRNAEALMASLKLAYVANRRQMESIAQVQAKYLESRFQTGNEIAIAARCWPCADVGGDFYFAGMMPDGRTSICIADVAGHGAVAAVNMAVSRALLRVALLEGEPQEGPAEVFMRLGEWLQNELESEQFVTMWLGIWDPATARLSYVSAAHPDAIYWPVNGEPRFLTGARGLPLGLAGIEPMLLTAESVSLNVGDRVFLYTDAWTETPSASGKELEGDLLLDFIANATQQPLKAVPDILFMEFERHAANMRIRDDVSLLVFERIA